MNNEQILAKRYAQSFLNVFSITNEDLDGLKEIIAALSNHKEMLSMLKIPLIDASIKARALKTYIEQVSHTASFGRLIALLVDQKRSYLLPQVLEQIIFLYQEQHGIEAFAIASSVPLNADDMIGIQKFLTRITRHAITCTQVHDANLIVGIRMQSAYYQWEYSVRKQLTAIARSFTD